MCYFPLNAQLPVSTLHTKPSRGTLAPCIVALAVLCHQCLSAIVLLKPACCLSVICIFVMCECSGLCFHTRFAVVTFAVVVRFGSGQAHLKWSVLSALLPFFRVSNRLNAFQKTAVVLVLLGLALVHSVETEKRVRICLF